MLHGGSTSSRWPHQTDPSPSKRYWREQESLEGVVDTVHPHALTAANIAFRQGFGNRNGAHSTSLETKEPPSLERKRSVRFTGPNAVSIDRPITRRVAPEWRSDANLQFTRYGASGLGRTCLEAGRQRRQARSTESLLTALPQVESAATPSSYRKVRKVRSMFTRQASPSVFAHGTPTSRSTSRARRLSGSTEAVSVGLGPAIRAGAGFKTPFPHLQQHYDQDAAIQMAREQYLRQLEAQRLKQQPLRFKTNKPVKPQKSFRRTVRSNSTNSYGSAISSEPVTAPKALLGRRVSVSIRKALKRVFRVNAKTNPPLPSQHVDASRLHFRDYISTDLRDEPSMSASNAELLDPVHSQIPPPWSSDQLQMSSRPGSPKSVRSVDSVNAKSRITSWGDSSAANTLQKYTSMERKRLSIIQEHGGPHQSERKGYAVFRKPINIDPSRRVPLDSQRVFSALQKHFAETGSLVSDKHRLPSTDRHLQDLDSKGKRDSSSGGHLGNESQEQQLLELGRQKSRLYPDIPDAGRLQTAPDAQPPPLQKSRSAQLGAIQSQDSDDVFRPVSPPAVVASQLPSIRLQGPSAIVRQSGTLTYQQLADQNERAVQQRQIREVKSAFFPSTTLMNVHKLSPYRQAIQSREEAVMITTMADQKFAPRSDSTSGEFAAQSAFSASSESIYSRATNGTPKPFETVLSFGESETRSNLPPPPRIGSTAVSAKTTEKRGDQREWSSYHAIAEKRPSDSKATPTQTHHSTSGHRRENAQFDDDDPALRSYPLSHSLIQHQPLATINFNAPQVSRYRQKAVNQMAEQYPLRFPLIQRAVSPPVMRRQNSMKALTPRSNNRQEENTALNPHSNPLTVSVPQASRRQGYTGAGAQFKEDDTIGAFARFQESGNGSEQLSSGNHRQNPREARLRRIRSSLARNEKENNPVREAHRGESLKDTQESLNGIEFDGNKVLNGRIAITPKSEDGKGLSRRNGRIIESDVVFI